MTVRNSIGEVIQFQFGEDSLDPAYMEGKIFIFIKMIESVGIFYQIFFLPNQIKHYVFW